MVLNEVTSCVVQLTQKEALVTLLDNRTWAKQGIAEDFDYLGHLQAWQHPQVNVFVTLVLFIVMKVPLPLLDPFLLFSFSEQRRCLWTVPKNKNKPNRSKSRQSGALDPSVMNTILWHINRPSFVCPGSCSIEINTLVLRVIKNRRL